MYSSFWWGYAEAKVKHPLSMEVLIPGNRYLCFKKIILTL